MKYEPHEYQRYATRYIENHPCSAVLLDMGLGKTSLTLTAFADLLFDSFEVHKVLVIAPLRVARDTWSAELQIPEATLLEITEEIGLSRITGITADNGNRLTLYLDDGSIIQKTWLDRSRSESWTDEMKKQAAKHAKKRYTGCQEEM